MRATDEQLFQQPTQPKLADVFLKSDVAGFAEWYEAYNCAKKLLWTVILLATFTLLGFYLAKGIHEYKESPLVNEFKLIAANDGVEFPEVYICPGNPIHMYVGSNFE